MKQISTAAMALLLVTGLSGCGGGETDNQTANSQEVDVGASEANMAADASNPFADSETRMSEQMMAAVGADVGDNWVRKMIVHHQGAIDMSRIMLDQNPTADVAEMARMTIEKQQKEIGELQKLHKEGAPDQRSAELYRPSMMEMQQKMQAATGADISETFMRKMLEHHRGGVTMSDVALQNGVAGQIRAKAQKTRSDQQKEAEMVEAMLRGEPMSHAMPKPEAKKAPEKPAPMKSGAAPSTTKTTPAAKPADEHAGHDMSKM
jgi:uncharacterized protein (DUF305 family)